MMKVIKQKVDRNGYGLSYNNSLVNDQSIEDILFCVLKGDERISLFLLSAHLVISSKLFANWDFSNHRKGRAGRRGKDEK